MKPSVENNSAVSPARTSFGERCTAPSVWSRAEHITAPAVTRMMASMPTAHTWSVVHCSSTMAAMSALPTT